MDISADIVIKLLKKKLSKTNINKFFS